MDRGVTNIIFNMQRYQIYSILETVIQNIVVPMSLDYKVQIVQYYIIQIPSFFGQFEFMGNIPL